MRLSQTRSRHPSSSLFASGAGRDPGSGPVALASRGASEGDIRPWWSALAAIINQASFIATETCFYARNDLDMLEVGNTHQGTLPGNLTLDEAKSHFTSWALLKSPLLIGSDLTKASRKTIEILGNTDILRISQDTSVGESIAPFRWGRGVPDYTWDPAHPAAYWTGNSSYGVVFMVLNTLDTPQQMSFNLTDTPSTCGRRDWNCCLGAILTDYASSAFHRSESLAGGTEKGPLRLCGGRVQDHPSSGKNQGELRTNQPQLTPAQDDGRKRKFRVPRFVAGNQPVFWAVRHKARCSFLLRVLSADSSSLSLREVPS